MQLFVDIDPCGIRKLGHKSGEDLTHGDDACFADVLLVSMNFTVVLCFLWTFLVVFLHVEMGDKQMKNEQRVALKFLVKSGKRPCDCLRALRPVFGDRTMSETQLRFWHKRFREGDAHCSTADKPRPGRP